MCPAKLGAGLRISKASLRPSACSINRQACRIRKNRTPTGNVPTQTANRTLQSSESSDSAPSVTVHSASSLPAFRRGGSAPSAAARIVAFVSIIAAGACGGLIGFAVMEIECESDCQTTAGIVGAAAAAGTAAGTAVVAVLMLRSSAEWRAHSRAITPDGSTVPSLNSPSRVKPSQVKAAPKQAEAAPASPSQSKPRPRST